MNTDADSYQDTDDFMEIKLSWTNTNAMDSIMRPKVQMYKTSPPVLC